MAKKTEREFAAWLKQNAITIHYMASWEVGALAPICWLTVERGGASETLSVPQSKNPTDALIRLLNRNGFSHQFATVVDKCWPEFQSFLQDIRDS